MDQLNLWYQIYSETAQRNNIHLHSIDYFASILSVEALKAQSATEVLLLVAEIDGMPLAAMFLVISGNRGSYLYGASTSANRNFMATYALQWEAMRIAQNKGCTEYDMFGIAPNPDPAHPMHGLYRFKTGFGGNQYHTLGCWDYPLDHNKYQYLNTMEMSSQGYHLH
jgi:lipid II:glycine glycyltransferase (peptidoglycan interpeptide bridge formation enzyme)